MNKELFLEIGTEEIPAGFLPKAMADMEELARRELTAARLTWSAIRTMATPRRLVLAVEGLPAVQPDCETTVMGPARSIAFAPDGTPTRAAEGFARGQGVPVDSLTVVETEKGEYVAAVKKESGRPLFELFSEILPRLIGSIPFRKSMRWGDNDVRFARPIHWIVALFDGVVVPFSYGPVESGSISRGHRFMANVTFPVTGLAQYLVECERHFVIPDPEKRREIIRREIHRTAVAAGGKLLPDEGLLEEVTYLCEYPSVIHGTFPKEYLEVPKEVLITSMRTHQRYFSVVDEGGNLLNVFITVTNTVADDPSVVVRGNERVLRARLADARFFFEEDQKVRLEDRVEALKSVVYQQKLGTSYEKMERFRAVAVVLAERLNPSVVEKVDRAAFLCKGDLVTGMVGEFPEVQGIMGREYALLQGEDPDVARAIAEHYLPTQAGGALPSDDIGACVSIADKIDTICGCFGVGLIPTGSADPYALRRSALGIINIILDREYDLSLGWLVDASLDRLEGKLLTPREDVRRNVLEFFRGRLVNLLDDLYPPDVVDAVVSAGFDQIPRVLSRIRAIELFRSRPDITELMTPFKRVVNIVKEGVDTPVDPARFVEVVEGELYTTLSGVEERVAEALHAGDYLPALETIASLRGVIDRFFEGVMVMADDPAIRTNRLALLTRVAALFRGIADFSKLSG